MQHIRRSTGLILLILAAVLLVACAGEETPEKIEPVQIEVVAGSEFNHVTLTERAAERLGIETASVHEGETSRTQTVEDQVIVQKGQVTDPSEGLVHVALKKSTLSRVDGAQPARILLQADDDEDEGFLAEKFEPPDSDAPGDVDEDGEDEDGEDEDAEDEDLYFVMDSAASDLTEGQSVFVKLPLAEGGAQRLVIPYSAVIYGLNGETWAYTNPEPLTFVRYPITVDHIEGGQAFLFDGPPVGTEVATVGVAELYGADTGVGK